MCPPLDGPGVPPERVEAVSSWSLFHEVCAERERERQSGNKAHNQASDHTETHTGYSPMLQRQLALSDVPHFIVFHPISRPYNITRQFSQHSLQERLNQTLSLSILMTPHNRWLPYRHFFHFTDQNAQLHYFKEHHKKHCITSDRISIVQKRNIKTKKYELAIAAKMCMPVHTHALANLRSLNTTRASQSPLLYPRAREGISVCVCTGSLA